MLHSRHLEFHSCVFAFGRTYMAPNSLTLHKPVSCLVSGLFNCLVKGAHFPCLAVKVLSEGSLLTGGGALFVVTHWVPL